MSFAIRGFLSFSLILFAVGCSDCVGSQANEEGLASARANYEAAKKNLAAHGITVRSSAKKQGQAQVLSVGLDPLEPEVKSGLFKNGKMAGDFDLAKIEK